jgi:F-type H+-transporting ATPase subunit epsilon
MAAFPARLVTPERVLLEVDVQAVILRTDEGDIAFMPGHTPLVGSVVPGPVRFQREDETEERVAQHGGFVQVNGDRVVVLVPVAERAADIDVERARRALEAAEQRVAELGGSRPSEGEETSTDRDLTEAENARRRAQVRLEVAGAIRPEVTAGP